MKILFVCNEYPPSPHGGIGTFVRTLARQLAARGTPVAVVGYALGLQADSLDDDRGVRVYRLADPYRRFGPVKVGRYAFDLLDLPRRLYLSQRVDQIAVLENSDLVESYDWSGPLGRKTHAPLVMRLHGANSAYAFYENRKPGFGLKQRESANIAMADRLVAVSRHIGEITAAAMGRALPFEVIYNGVDTRVFSPGMGDVDADQILYVGSVTRRKGIYELLKAAALILPARPETYFTFVGNLSEMERLQVEIALNDLAPMWQEKFHFIGRVPHQQLPEYYRQAAVVVFPSLAEAFGLTCVEAMACGKAVAATTLASGPELVEHERSGLLADPTRPKEFAAAVLRLLEDASLADQLGRAARERTLALFNLQDLAERNLAFYREVLS